MSQAPFSAASPAPKLNRRRFLSTSGAATAVLGVGSVSMLLPQIMHAQSNKIRVGIMLPYTGTFAQLGVAIENGMRLALDQAGGKLGGRDIEFFKADDSEMQRQAMTKAVQDGIANAQAYAAGAKLTTVGVVEISGQNDLWGNPFGGGGGFQGIRNATP